MAPKLKRSQKPRLRMRASSGGISDAQRISAYHEGATTGTTMGQKGLKSSGPNSEIERSQRKLIKRSRYAIANHPYGVTASNVYVDNLIGTGVIAAWENPELQALWDLWITECDADGQLNFAGIQALIARAEFSDGEVLIRRRWRRTADGLSVPFQIEVLESDMLPLHMSDTARGVRMGIQKNGIGQRTHYHLFEHHPDDMPSGIGVNETRAVPASDVLHYFQVLRPKQDRGLPTLSAVLLRLYEIDEMQSDTLKKQKAAALFAWIITKNDDEWDGDIEGDDGIDEDYEVTSSGEAVKKIKAGGIHRLQEGESITFSDPKDIGSNYSEWMKAELRAVAKAMGLTYEQLSGDLTGVNYSSIRAGLVEFRRRMERLQHHLVIFKCCHPVAKWFLAHVMMNRLVKLPDYDTNPQQYLPKWQTPRWDWVDPLKDVMADLLEVRGGFNNRAAKNAERGINYDQNNKQLMKEQGVDKPEDLILDSLPNKVTKAGQMQSAIDLLAQELITEDS